ncbi:MAG: peptidase M24 [Bacteroidetes bacterium SW_9_63_38]|nr:MAG: peptidase M24 [Bacteroidetes bacterium SW_9_63_38]
MWSFLVDLLRRPGSTHTVVVMDEEKVGRTRRYQVQPKWLLAVWGGSLFVIAVAGASLLALTPLRTFVPGYGMEQLRRNARLNAIRVAALQDSVAAQRQYIKRFQQLVTGRVDSVARTATQEASDVAPAPTADRRPVPEPAPAKGGDPSERQVHNQPAIAVSGFSATGGEDYVRPTMSLPIQSPVETGFTTRGFDADDSHFGTDLAVSEGTRVRAMSEGYVVLADWTREGGFTVAVQHTDGYLSVYKHNKRLLKQTGDHVKARETLAVTGNSGEVTTGPHLHFELWRNGLAQDPRPYVIGW